MTDQLLYGRHAVEEALRAKRREIALVQTTDDAIERLAREAGVACERRTKAELDALVGAGVRHQGVIATVREYAYAPLESLLAGPNPLVMALDSVTDPQNLGSLVRSVHVMGGAGLIVPKDRSARVTAAVVRASAGATEHIPIVQVANLARTLETLKESGLWIVGTTLDKEAEPPWRIDLTGPIVLVVGAEGTGIRPLIRKICDLRVSIPMHGSLGSLNAAVSGAVLLYEALRQRAGAQLSPQGL